MKTLKIVSVMSDDKHDSWRKIASEWERYFKISHEIMSPTEYQSWKKKKTDILFVDAEEKELIAASDYETYKKKEAFFSFAFIMDEPDETVPFLYKVKLADQVIYRNFGWKSVKWHTIAILRRYWKTHSKPSTIIHRGIIADFVDGYVTVDGEEKILTMKELRLLNYFLTHIGEFIPKQELFRKIWKIKEDDNTRTVDQMLFKLRNKIGKSYFTISRNQGIKLH